MPSYNLVGSKLPVWNSQLDEFSPCLLKRRFILLVGGDMTLDEGCP